MSRVNDRKLPSGPKDTSKDTDKTGWIKAAAAIASGKSGGGGGSGGDDDEDRSSTSRGISAIGEAGASIAKTWKSKQAAKSSSSGTGGPKA